MPHMSEEYSTWKFLRHTLLGVVMATVIVLLATIAGNTGEVSEGVVTLTKISGYAIAGYMALPLIQLLSGYLNTKLDAVYAKHT